MPADAGAIIGVVPSRNAAIHIAVIDFVANSFIPALAAEELGVYRAEGLEAAVAQGTPWVLVLRADLGARGEACSP